MRNSNMTPLAKSIAMVLVAACMTYAGLAAAPAQAQRSSSGPTGDEVLDIVFSTVEQRIIEDYFGVRVRDEDGRRAGRHGPKHKGKGRGRGRGGGLPPGLAKRKSLPPGLAKRKSLPPGLAKRDLPSGLDGRLGPPSHGTERIIVDRNVLLVETATGIVLDILEDVIRNQ